MKLEALTAVCAPLWFVFGQSFHHVLDPPKLLLDLDVPLARRFCLKRHTLHTQDTGEFTQVHCGNSPSAWGIST